MVTQSFLRSSFLFLSLTLLASTALAQQLVPGTFEAEDFDQGGEGVGYHENTPGNQGDAGFRAGEDVDIFVSNDAAGGGRIIKNFEAGEWLAYTISVPADDSYNLEVRASTNSAFPNSAYYVQVDGINVTGTITLPDTGGWDRYFWLGTRTIALTAGTHLLRIVSVTPYFALNSIRVVKVPSTPYYGWPPEVPGEFEAEAFDAGGEGVAYHDNAPGNQGNAGVRDGEDVDIFVSNDAASGSPNIVKNFEAGEWLSYTVMVSNEGSYDIELRASTQADFPDPAYHLEVDGINVTGTVVLPDTGGWDNYQWLGKTTVALTFGTHVLKVVSERPYFALNSIRANLTGQSHPIHTVPGQIEAEDFFPGGEGVGYHDNSPGNQGNAGFRTGEDVDIFSSNDAGSGSWYVVKNFEAGEWLDYSINAATGFWFVELRASTNAAFPESAYHIEVAGTRSESIVLPDTGGWDNYQWVGKTKVLITDNGPWVLRIVVDKPYFSLNAIRVTSAPSYP